MQIRSFFKLFKSKYPYNIPQCIKIINMSYEVFLCIFEKCHSKKSKKLLLYIQDQAINLYFITLNLCIVWLYMADIFFTTPNSARVYEQNLYGTKHKACLRYFPSINMPSQWAIYPLLKGQSSLLLWLYLFKNVGSGRSLRQNLF